MADTQENRQILANDSTRIIRLGLLTLAVGFVGFLIWASFAPLDEGVPTQGMVTIDTKSKPVQHLTGGLVDQILVKEGQLVKAGQVIARMNSGASKANYESLHQKYMGLRAMESRLLAQQKGANQISFPREILSSNDLMIKLQMATQRTLLLSNQAALNAELNGIQQSILAEEATIQGFKGQQQSQIQQEVILTQELDAISQMVAEGYETRTRQLELERLLASAKGTITELNANSLRSNRIILELKQRAEQRRQEAKKETDRELASIRLEIDGEREKFQAAAEDLQRTEIHAPVSGQVVALAVQSPGAVIQSGQKLMDIVPLDEYLILETRIPPNMIDRVAEGQKTDVRFNSFAHSPSLVAEGIVRSISRDLVTEQTQNGVVSFYLARIALTETGMKTLGNRQMQAGMPAEVIIKTGERSLLKYIVFPLTKRIAASMKEE
ncbi:AcrA Membrane-fusion protein [Methylophilaceae bacterium]